MIGTAIGTGALTGIGFWAPTFYERHTSLTSSQASGVVGGLILVGACWARSSADGGGTASLDASPARRWCSAP